MATHDYDIANQSGAAFRVDLNNVLDAIQSNNSNSSSPATTVSYQWWADTTAGVMKIRNAANDGWITLFQLDGTLTLEDGSASTPALAFRDDLDTGIFSAGSKELNIATNGVERVGFTASETTFNQDGADTDFRIEGDTQTNLFKLDAGSNNIAMAHATPVFSTGNGLHLADSFFLGLGTGNGTRPDFQIGTTAGATLDFRCGTGADTADIVFDSSGQIGIGTTSPSYILDVNADGGAAFSATTNSTNGQISIVGKNSSGSVSAISRIKSIPDGSSNQSHMSFETRNSSSSMVEAIRISSSQKVGITLSGSDNTSPVRNLDIADSSGAILRLISSDDSLAANERVGEIEFFTDDDDSPHISSFIKAIAEGSDAFGRRGALTFGTRADSGDATEKCRIDHLGRFAIGTTSPVKLLTIDTGTGSDGIRLKSDEVNLTIATSNTGDSLGRGITFNASRQDSGSLPNLVLGGQGGITLNVDVNNTRMTVDTSGNIGAPSGTNIFNASDSRLKTNIVDLDKGLAEINKLRPVSFNWIDGFCDVEKDKLYGFIAQEVQTLDSNLIQDFSSEVTLNPDTENETKITDVLRVNEKFIIPMLVKAVQELSAKVAALEAA